MGIGERESRRYWGQQLVVRGQLHSPMGKLVMHVAHVGYRLRPSGIRARRCFSSKRTLFHVALELEHVESVVDLRSEICKADALLPAFALRASAATHSSASRAARQVSFVVSTRGATHQSTESTTAAARRAAVLTPQRTRCEGITVRRYDGSSAAATSA